ncbi:peroxisomal membrane protein PEX13 [Cylas formicarius]|uniref:peroxisomal membrane protein PEX13 n=1 Tax=Cylas formicarius TaxID=197179 RepID=UPI0029587727|nr:peroxisomal membrane protein PEX13 [Cylas formicarius]
MLNMTSPLKPWEAPNALQNSTQFIRAQNSGTPLAPGRMAPALPPRPSSNSNPGYYGSYNSYLPYSSLSSMSSYGSPYQSPMYNSYGSSYAGYNMYGYPGLSRDDSERRFVQYVEENSRHTFANVESLVRAFNSFAMMLDNTFFAMTSSFRAILSVAENFGKLRTTFGQIWYSVNIFRFFSWAYRKIRRLLGLPVPHSSTSLAWNEAVREGGLPRSSPASSWPTLAFLGVIVSAPYIISRFLPKYEDKSDPGKWKAPGIRAKACFDFVATSANELPIQTNDRILLAPTYIQEEMNLKNTGWAFAVKDGKSGVVPLNYILIDKNNNSTLSDKIPVPRTSNVKPETATKNHTKRVSFGDIQFFEDDSGEPVVKKLGNDDTDKDSAGSSNASNGT